MGGGGHKKTGRRSHEAKEALDTPRKHIFDEYAYERQKEKTEKVQEYAFT